MKKVILKSNAAEIGNLSQAVKEMREVLFHQSHVPLSPYRVDYHFHPNLPVGEKAALDKCKSWWQEFEKKGINVVVITEHVYKHPERAFKLMQETKPEGCYVFPGMEYLTKEGIDIIIFANNQEIYHYDQLKPYYLTLDQTLDFVSKHNLKAFITHPHTLGNTSVIRKTSAMDYVKYVNKIRSLEVTNTSFNQLFYLLNRPLLRSIFARAIQKILNTRKVPFADYPSNLKLITAGSDAHNLGEIGTHVLIRATQNNLFDAIASNVKPIIVETYAYQSNKSLFFLSIMTSFSEGLIKLRIRILARISKWMG